MTDASDAFTALRPPPRKTVSPIRVLLALLAWTAIALLCYLNASNGALDVHWIDGHRPTTSLLPIRTRPAFLLQVGMALAVEPGRWLMLGSNGARLPYVMPLFHELGDFSSAELFFRIFSFVNALCWLLGFFALTRLVHWFRARRATTRAGA